MHLKPLKTVRNPQHT